MGSLREGAIPSLDCALFPGEAPENVDEGGCFTGNSTVKQEFHVKPDGETTSPGPFEIGYFLGILAGEGHFRGDGKQPQVTLRMHTDHEALFRWIETTFPGGRLYGPYHHGGRHYYQWMARGRFLRETLMPLLEEHLKPELDGKTYRRFVEMVDRYRL